MTTQPAAHPADTTPLTPTAKVSTSVDTTSSDHPTAAEIAAMPADEFAAWFWRDHTLPGRVAKIRDRYGYEQTVYYPATSGTVAYPYDDISTEPPF